MWNDSKTIITACALGALLVATADGQTPLTLGDLQREVTRVNPRVSATQASARAAEARVAGARRPPDPQVQLGLMNYALPSFAPMAGIGMAQIQVMQMLPLGGKLGLAGQVAETRASAAARRVTAVEWDIRSDAAMAFYDGYVVARKLEIDRETLHLLQDIESVAASMYRVGEGRQTDVLKAQVEIAKMVEDTVRMRAMQTVMTGRLNALLDRASDSVIGSPVLPRFPETVPTLASLDSLAVANRPMIRAAMDEARGAFAAERLAKREIWPDLQVGVQYGQRGGEMGTERMASLMVGASVPIFARDRQYRMRDEAAAMARMAAADVNAMRAETRARIAEAYANLLSARHLASLYRSTILPQADATVTSALAAYRVGGVDFMTLLDARMSTNKYRKELESLSADEGKAWAELEMLTGTTLVADTATNPREGAR